MKKMIFILMCMIFFLYSCKSAGVSSNSYDVSRDSELTKGSLEYTISNDSEIYNKIIASIIEAFPWNDNDLQIVSDLPDLSYMYLRHTELSEVGYALLDIDGNGQQELIISGIEAPFIYDLYTVIDGDAVHLFSSGERYAYSLYKDGYVENVWSAGAAVSGNDFYRLKGGNLELIERIATDAYWAMDMGLIKDVLEAEENGCFFRSLSENYKDNEWISYEQAMERLDALKSGLQPLDIKYTPFQ